MRGLLTLLICWTALVAMPARADLKVLACEPEWAALVKELAGDQASVALATTAYQDPHRIEARPSLIARARNADLLVCTGAELEAGWLPVLQRESGNARIQPGTPGHFEAAAFVALLDRPARVDRSMGDVHAAGNPHLHLDPRNISRLAEALAARLAQLDKENAAHYAARHRGFQQRWQAALARWQERAVPLGGVPLATHHKDWVYLAHWLDMKVVVTLEPKPGVEPSVAWLGEVLNRLRQQPVRLVAHTNYQSPRASRWLSERAGVPVVELPHTVGAAPGTDSLFAWMDALLDRLLAIVK
ncbi:MAG: zinc ABC transporter substrate-binding protein [Thiobacillus sp.]|nr:zinc ABC transporter substrate-binding protein [Thiobacillus sp.]